MKYAIIIALTLASSTVFAHDDKPIDADCAKMAMNARGFAELRQGGIATTEDQLEKFVVTPTVQTYPIRSLLEYVLNQPETAPQQVYNSLYLKCTLMGYKELLGYFNEREDVDRLNAALTDRDATINQLRQQVATLTQENTELKYTPVHHHRVDHVRPIVVPVTHPVRSTANVVVRPTTTIPYGCTLANGQPCRSN